MASNGNGEDNDCCCEGFEDLGAIDPLDDRAIYRQIADKLRDHVLHDCSPGQQLPSERELSRIFLVSRITTRQAMGLLEQEGLIDAKQGSGYFVRETRPVRRMEARRLSRAEYAAGRGLGLTDSGGQRADMRDLTVMKRPALPWVAKELGIDDDSIVLVRRRRTFIDGAPAEITTNYYPFPLVDGTIFEHPEIIFGNYYYTLEELTGFKIIRFREVLSTRMPLPDEAHLLGLRGECGVPVLRKIQTALTDDNTALTMCEMLLAGDRWEFEYDISAI